MSELVNPEWPQRTIKESSYLKGRIGWQGLRADEFIDDGPYLITGTDFHNGVVEWDSCYHVSEARFQEGAYIHIRNGDLLITKDGTIGKIAYVSNCPDKAVLNSGIFLLRCLDGSYDHRFLFHLLRSNVFSEFLRLNLAGSTINHLYQNVFEKFSFPTPTLAVQKRIASVLDYFDSMIEQAEALIVKHQQIKAGLIHDLFTRGVTPDGHLRLTREEAPHLYKESPLGWIPKKWEVVTVGSCLIGIDAGKSPECPDIPASSDQWGVLKVGAVDPDGLREEENKTVLDWRLQNSAFLVCRNDLLISRANTFDLVGLVCHVTGNPRNLMLSDKTLRLHPNSSRVTTRFLFWSLQTAPARRQIENSATGTSGSMKNISQGSVRAILLTRPELDEQARINTRIDALADAMASLRVDIAKLSQQKHGLMHDLLTGRVRVPVTDA
jgi:type I restriction enzyme S subunit